MEKLQIARPSTYGSIFQKLEDKKHIAFDKDGFIQLTIGGDETYQAIRKLKPIVADPGLHFRTGRIIERDRIGRRITPHCTPSLLVAYRSSSHSILLDKIRFY